MNLFPELSTFTVPSCTLGEAVTAEADSKETGDTDSKEAAILSSYQPVRAVKTACNRLLDDPKAPVQ